MKLKEPDIKLWIFVVDASHNAGLPEEVSLPSPCHTILSLRTSRAAALSHLGCAVPSRPATRVLVSPLTIVRSHCQMYTSIHAAARWQTPAHRSATFPHPRKRSMIPAFHISRHDDLVACT